MCMAVLKTGQHQATGEVYGLGLIIHIVSNIRVIAYGDDAAIFINYHRTGPGLLRIDGVNRGVVQQQGRGLVSQRQAAAKQQSQR